MHGAQRRECAAALDERRDRERREAAFASGGGVRVVVARQLTVTQCEALAAIACLRQHAAQLERRKRVLYESPIVAVVRREVGSDVAAAELAPFTNEREFPGSTF